MADLGWTNIKNYVATWHLKETSKAGDATWESFYKILGNQCLNELSDLIGGIPRTWAGPTELTISSGVVALPTDCILIKRVEWGSSDNPLERLTIEQLDEDDPGWRDVTGTPDCYVHDGNSLILVPKPTGVADGLLTVRGTGILGNFDDSVVNPLLNLMQPYQLLPAYYILKELPVSRENPVEVYRQAKHEDLYEKGKLGLIDAKNRRDLKRFTYD
jgi:hypothetical protein